MKERNDDQLRGVAMAAFDSFERSVTAADTEQALASVRERIAAGDAESLPPLPLDDLSARRDRRATGWMIGAAASVVVLLIGGLVVVNGRTDDASTAAGDSLPPVSSSPATPPPTVVTTIAATTTVESTVPAPSTTVVPTTSPSPVVNVEDAPTTTVVPATTAAPATTVVPTTTVAPASVDPARLAIPRNCVEVNVCTQLDSTEDGRIVAFDPTDNTLRTYTTLGDALLAEVPIDQEFADPYPDSEIGAAVVVEHVGPDDVAYLSYFAVGAGDVMRDLIAVPLNGPSAGSVIERWQGLDGSGDSDLVPTRTGLAVVGCCGSALTRPAPDATVFGYVDRNGSPIESDAPVFRLDLGDAGNELARIDASGDETRFRLPTVASYPRGMPPLVAADDGGAVMSIYSIQYNQSFVVDFDTDWPQYRVDPADVYVVDEGAEIWLIEPAGTVVVAEGDGFVRSTLGEIATGGWPGQLEVDIDAGTSSAPGLNDHIAANQPSWAADPILLGLQLSPWADPNERVDIQFDEATSSLTLTISGFLDDSAEGVQRVIQLERDPNDGLWRFVSGTYGWRCQPGRGHQDYSVEFCI